METRRLETLKQIAAGVAAQFGSNCEVVIHDVSGNRPDHTIVHIENGHVSGRKVGDGASRWCWTNWPGRTSSQRITCAI